MKKNKLNPIIRFSRNLVLLLVMLLSVQTLTRAQLNYNFSTLSAPYSYLTGDTSLNNGLVWLVPTYEAPIGFNFEFLGNTASITGSMGSTFAEINLKDTTSGNEMNLIVMGESIMDRAVDFINGPDEGDPGSISKISYKTEGSAGDQIFKIQWQNAGFIEEYLDDDISVDSVNLQIWLYEKDGAIEYRYGPASTTQPNLCYSDKPGPKVLLELTINNVLSVHHLIGNPSSPVVYSSSAVADTGMTASIQEGTVYRFEPVVPLSIKDSKTSNKLSIYPNPSSGIIHISNLPIEKISSIELFNTLGQKLATMKPTLDIDLSVHPDGVYLIRLHSDDTEYNTSVFKQ